MGAQGVTTRLKTKQGDRVWGVGGGENKSDAARSWGASAVLGRQRGLGGFPHSRFAVVSPMSNWRGFPHERLHQDREFGVSRCNNNRSYT
ncbi:hypothetical protein BJP37_23095 [Moorena bouillonii PNG]|uniref:Uncharacterized protein n=1 Tax=Moorena bouillonii PNG TaxID=568701 RepID=A0A1U7N6D3_9CYAN|nr:hypothetical protein BJP37_23095 [Moorena bouillonii PNG]